jgi:hypothetical protein
MSTKVIIKNITDKDKDDIERRVKSIINQLQSNFFEKVKDDAFIRIDIGDDNEVLIYGSVESEKRKLEIEETVKQWIENMNSVIKDALFSPKDAVREIIDGGRKYRKHKRRSIKKSFRKKSHKKKSLKKKKSSN